MISAKQVIRQWVMLIYKAELFRIGNRSLNMELFRLNFPGTEKFDKAMIIMGAI